MKINYTEKDGILYPNLQVDANCKTYSTLGRFGKMKYEFMNESNRFKVIAMEIEGTLWSYLHNIDNQAMDYAYDLEKQMLKANPPSDPSDILATARHRRQIISCVDEIVLAEIIYVPN